MGGKARRLAQARSAGQPALSHNGRPSHRSECKTSPQGRPMTSNARLAGDGFGPGIPRRHSVLRIDGEHAVGNAAQDILRVLLLQGDFARQLLRAPVDLRLALLQGQEFLLLGRDITLQAPGIDEAGDSQPRR